MRRLTAICHERIVGFDASLANGLGDLDGPAVIAIVERPGVVAVDDSPVQATRVSGSGICSIGPSTHT